MRARARVVVLSRWASQTYKSFWCFATSWLVVPFTGGKVQYTPWGIVSALFWVPAGVAAVIAVEHSGLALSQVEDATVRHSASCHAVPIFIIVSIIPATVRIYHLTRLRDLTTTAVFCSALPRACSILSLGAGRLVVADRRRLVPLGRALL